MYPIFLNIESKLVVVIGGGTVALRKATKLLQSGAIVKVVSPKLIPEFIQLLENFKDSFSIIERNYEYGDLSGSILVFSATDERDVNLLVQKEANEKNILINATDDPSASDFMLPSLVKRGDLNIAISTSGASPAYSSKIKKDLESQLDDNIDDILILLRKIRNVLIESKFFKELTSPQRGDVLRKIVNDENITTKLLLIQNEEELIDALRKL